MNQLSASSRNPCIDNSVSGSLYAAYRLNSAQLSFRGCHVFGVLLRQGHPIRTYEWSLGKSCLSERSRVGLFPIHICTQSFDFLSNHKLGACTSHPRRIKEVCNVFGYGRFASHRCEAPGEPTTAAAAAAVWRVPPCRVLVSALVPNAAGDVPGAGIAAPSNLSITTTTSSYIIHVMADPRQRFSIRGDAPRKNPNMPSSRQMRLMAIRTVAY